MVKILHHWQMTSPPTLDEFNHMPAESAAALLTQCCAAEAWVAQVVQARPFQNLSALISQADLVWEGLQERDYLQAFEAHPKIGDVNSLREKYANTKAMAGGEQSGVDGADDDVILRLSDGNTAYENKFGFIFIVCATGKSAAEMLALLEARLPNSRDTEIKNASIEQAKITTIRLNKMLAS